MAKSPAAIIYNSAGTEQILATEAKLEAVRVLLADLSAEDFSTEATLDAFLTAFNGTDFATQTTLASLLSAFNSEDFSTETTLAALKASFEAEDFASETTLAAFKASFEAEDFATQTTLAAFKAAFDAEDFATQTTLAAILVDTGQIEALLTTIDADTSALAAVDFATQTTLAAFLAAFNAEDFATQTTLAALLTKNTEIDAVLDTIYTRQNDRSQKTQLTNGTLDVTVSADAAINRLEIQGKVQTIGAIAPPATTPVNIFGDTPLVVGTHDTVFTIPDGETFSLQQITAGNEDPSKGASVELIFDNGTEHLIERVYIAGQTVSIGYADISNTRNGILLLGNGAGTSDIIVRRAKYAGTDIAIDAEIVGYTA